VKTLESIRVISYDVKNREEISMNWWKIILFAVLLVVAVYLGITVIGFLYSAFWYLLALGIAALGGFAGYKYLTRNSRKEIEGKDGVSQFELDNAKIVKELEDLKKKINR
jgi:hypothetical protein